MSADGGHGWWVGAPFLAAESMAQGVDDVMLEAESDVGVNAGGDAEVAQEAVEAAGEVDQAPRYGASSDFL
ncbi:hypothetical protein Slala02_46190 [Streptomyces lavendulae subsp. lavendulae]|nr:hypothetical protein Slala01_19190 [Streptomyces lavendulae subsp. lavendulae]GLX28799.1 hypothetical protein Slala02_46190 [Streptomyces lavendulae subsp. lavendulae]